MIEFDGFDWDAGSCQKRQKHGVSIPEIEGLFDRIILIGPDRGHSSQEVRFRAIGTTADKRRVFLAFTWRMRFGARSTTGQRPLYACEGSHGP